MFLAQRCMNKSAAVLAVMIFAIAIACAAGKGKGPEWKFIGPRGTGARCIRFDPSDPSRVYSLIGYHRIYASRDAGKTWRYMPWSGPKYAGQPPDQYETWPGAVEDITVGKDGTVYACSRWVYRSVDHAKTWRKLQGADQVSGVAASTAGVVLAFKRQGLYRSADSGETWKMVKPGAWHSDAISAVHPKDMSLIFIETPDGDGSRGLLRSVDSGATWQKMATTPRSPIAALAPDPANSKILYCTAADGFYRSDDRGDSWVRTYASDRFWQASPALAVDPHSPKTIYAQTTTGIAVSRDGGRKWANINKPYLRQGYHAAIGASSDAVLIAKVSAMWRSGDHGARWSDVSAGFRPMPIEKVAADYARRGCFYAKCDPWGPALLRTTDGGKHWYETGIHCDEVVTLPSKPGTVVASGTVVAYSYNHVVWISHDSGATWAERHGTVAGSRSALTFSVDPASPDHMYVAGWDGISASSDGGLTWSASKVPQPDPKLAVSAIVVSPVDGTVYAGTRTAEFYDVLHGGPAQRGPQTVHRGIYASADRGTTWEATPASESPTAEPSRFPENVILAPDPRDANVLYAAGPPGLTRTTFFKSTDRGQSWIYRDDSPIRAQVTSIVIDPADTRRIYLATYSDGVFASRDAGETWVNLIQGLTYYPRSQYAATLDVAVDPFDRTRLYAATQTGLYTLKYK